jgi:hypothetical protein
MVHAQDNSLKRVRQRMADSIGLTQDFLCTESIERTTRSGGAPASPKILKTDAGIINGKELYAWPSNDADLASLRDLLDQYANFGTGSFALYTRPLFLTNNASFYPAADETKDGRRLLKFEFAMPKETSRYSLTVNGKAIPLGYTGSVLADPDKNDPVRIESHADSIPAATGLKDVAQTIEYGRVQIGLSTVLLPVSSELVVQEASGRESRISTRYDSCRLYTTKAGTRFIEGVIETEPVSATEGLKALPPKTSLDLILEDPIDERTTTPGTPLNFRLARDLKSGGTVLARKGAVATGKVTRTSRHSYRAMDSTKGYYIIGVQLETLQGEGQKYAVNAGLDTIGPASTITCFLPYSQSPDKWGLFEEVRDQFDFPSTLMPGETIIGLVREYMRIPKNIRMVWVTK